MSEIRSRMSDQRFTDSRTHRFTDNRLPFHRFTDFTDHRFTDSPPHRLTDPRLTVSPSHRPPINRCQEMKQLPVMDLINVVGQKQCEVCVIGPDCVFGFSHWEDCEVIKLGLQHWKS